MVLAISASVPMVLHALHLRARMRHEAEDRASSLSRQDALTGLLIKPLFMTHIEGTLERALNDKESAAIVLVEVVNHAHLREAFGESVAEQCLLRAVVKLHRVLRDVDPAGRVDTSRFGLILEGVRSRQVLSERMVSLIASGLIPLPGLKPEATLQFHVACVMLNEIVPAANTLLEQLGDVLDNISPRSRRPIRFLEPAHTVPASYDGDSILVTDDHESGSSMASHTSHPPASHLPAEGI
jgi:two-component system, sensor histidine kinase LadS